MSSWSSAITIRSRGRPSRRKKRAPPSSCTKCGRKRTSLSLPVKAEHETRRNIRNILNEYASFKKEAKREPPVAVTKMEVWKGDLQDVIDIDIVSGKIAEAKVTQEDLAFLELQREDNRGLSIK